MSSFDPLELVADLPQHRERRIDAVVDDLVEQVARTLGEERVAQLLARAAALEQVLERLDRLVGQRDQEVGADEQVQLGGVQPRDRLVVAREVQDAEQVVVVLVDLRALVAREDVLVVERVELEPLLEPGAIDLARPLDVDPAEAGGLDDLDAGLFALRGALGDAARAPRRPNGLLGRLGIAETERVVGQGQHHGVNSTTRAEIRHPPDVRGILSMKSLRNAGASATVLSHIAVRIKRGGGICPVKPRQPSSAPALETVAIPSGSK